MTAAVADSTVDPSVSMLNDAASRFLQSVVVVDDQAYELHEEQVFEQASLGGDSLDEPDQRVNEPGDIEDLESLDTETIVEGFADLGMACAVLAPSNSGSDEDTARVLKLAARSDIVVLDWVIRPTTPIDSQGKRTNERTSKEILLKILQEDEKSGSRVRLICIYTGSNDAPLILEQLESSLTGDSVEIAKDVKSARIDVAGARIVVLSKVRKVPTPGVPVVAADDLPARVVQEFREFAAKGFLPEIALGSLAAVRDDSHRILKRFSGDLDPALIAHRAVTSALHTEELVLSLVGNELSTIVAASDSFYGLTDQTIQEAVESAMGDRQEAYLWEWRRLIGNPKTTLSGKEKVAEDKLFNPKLIGRNDAINELTGKPRKNGPKGSRTSLLLAGESETVRLKASKIDLAFSALSVLARDNSFEGSRSVAPGLQLGTILRSVKPKASAGFYGPLQPSVGCGLKSREFPSKNPNSTIEPNGNGEEYDFWICMQPLCDSVRLAAATKFPLLPIMLLSDNSKRFDIVVHVKNGYVPLEIKDQKISVMSLPSFAPDPTRQTAMAEWRNASWKFRDTAGLEYEWMGDLRLDKAHKILHSVVNASGRIGVNDYEFLRGIYDS